MLIDLIFAVLMVIAIIRGYQKGFILAVFSIIAFIIGLAAALKLSAVVAGYLNNSINISAKWLPFIAFILVFLVVVILVKLGARLIEKLIQAALLGWLNRMAGIVLYAALFMIVFSIFIFYAEKMNILKPAAIHASRVYPFIKPWGPVVMDNFGRLVPVFKDMFSDLGNFFNSLSNKFQH